MRIFELRVRKRVFSRHNIPVASDTSTYNALFNRRKMTLSTAHEKYVEKMTLGNKVLTKTISIGV